MRVNLWVIIYRSAWVALIAMLLAAIVCAFRPRCTQVRELQNRRARLEETNRQMESQIRDLRAKQRQFHSDPAFVERTAREESGLVRSNETVYRLGPEMAPAATGRLR
mgnify:CR=1 FL=1